MAINDPVAPVMIDSTASSAPLPVQYFSEPQAGNIGLGMDPTPISAPSGIGPGSYGGTYDHGLVGKISNFQLMDLVQMFVVYAFIIAAALAAIFIFIGGVSFILSGGNDDKIRQAVNTIRYAIVGLIVTILSFTFVTILGRMFGLNFLDYISYGQIKIAINRVVSGEEMSGGIPLPIAPDLNAVPIIDTRSGGTPGYAPVGSGSAPSSFSTTSSTEANDDIIIPPVAPLPRTRPLPSGVSTP